MSSLHPSIELQITLRSPREITSLTGLDNEAVIDPSVNKPFPEAQTEIRFKPHQVAPERVVTALKTVAAQINYCHVYARFRSDFWDAPPDDWAGTTLHPDGYVSTRDSTLDRRVIPLAEPVYTNGRPEADGEHKRFKPNVLSHVGGMPLFSDELIATLRKLGATGETANVIYRGFNKAAYDTPQPGYKRFFARPEFELPYAASVDFLPESVPANFGICSMLRVPTESLVRIDNKLSDDRWYEIALDVPTSREMRRLRKSVMLEPIFRCGGALHQVLSEFEAAIDELRA